MKLLFLGDVMGRAGRTAIIERLPKLRSDWGLDFVVVNGENASNGAGLTTAHAALLLEAGLRVDTGLLADQAERLNAGFNLRMASGRPRVTVKLALVPLNVSLVWHSSRVDMLQLFRSVPVAS